MKYRVVLLLCIGVWGVTGKVDHAELRGEHPAQEDIDNGQCIPMPCVLGEPPKECKRLCDLRHYETICQPPADLCLCRHWVHGKLTLVSPDEVVEQPLDSSEVLRLEKSEITEEPSKDLPQPMEPSNDKSQDDTTTDDGTISFQIYAVLLPIKQFFYESVNEVDTTFEPAVDVQRLGYEPVNVHEGRLFWDFRYILTGLLLLMIGLVIYELVMCFSQVYRSKSNISVKCEAPEVKVIPVPYETEKILKQ